MDDRTTDFSSLGLSEITLQALQKRGYTCPTPIQEQAIPLLLEGEFDVIGQARTGTGKTAAFAIPILETLTPGAKSVGAIVLTPTRELCMQVAAEISALADGRDIGVTAVFGGQNIEIQLAKLRRGGGIVVGTPGRVLDLISRRALKLENIEFFVLDEADEMLNMGFVEDIEKILVETPAEKRMLLFSATMPPPIRDIAEKFMRRYRLLDLRGGDDTPTPTSQYAYEIRREDKPALLMRMLDIEPEMFALVFCRTRCDVDELVGKLHDRGYRAEALHGDIAQAQRTRVIDGFKRRSFPLLIATDVAARGLDVNDLSHVINYSLPQSREIYIHRIGRTGRAGKSGTAVTFVTPGEKRKFSLLCGELSTSPELLAVPGGAEIARRKRAELIGELAAARTAGGFAEYRRFAAELLADGEPEEIFAAMLAVAFGPRFLDSNYPDFTGGKSVRRPSSEELLLLRIDAGRREFDGPPGVIELIYSLTGIRGGRLGRISCHDRFTLVEAAPDDAEKIMAAFASPRHGERLPRVALDTIASDRRGRSRRAGDAPPPDRPPRRRADGDRKPEVRPNRSASSRRGSLRERMLVAGELPAERKKRR